MNGKNSPSPEESRLDCVDLTVHSASELSDPTDREMMGIECDADRFSLEPYSFDEAILWELEQKAQSELQK